MTYDDLPYDVDADDEALLPEPAEPRGRQLLRGRNQPVVA
jgi:hypothetical protein